MGPAIQHDEGVQCQRASWQLPNISESSIFFYIAVVNVGAILLFEPCILRVLRYGRPSPSLAYRTTITTGLEIPLLVLLGIFNAMTL